MNYQLLFVNVFLSVTIFYKKPVSIAASRLMNTTRGGRKRRVRNKAMSKLNYRKSQITHSFLVAKKLKRNIIAGLRRLCRRRLANNYQIQRRCITSAPYAFTGNFCLFDLHSWVRVCRTGYDKKCKCCADAGEPVN